MGHRFFSRFSFLPFLVLVACATNDERVGPPASPVRPAAILPKLSQLLTAKRKTPLSIKESVSPRDAALDINLLTSVLDLVYGSRSDVPFDDYVLARFAFRTLGRKRGWDTKDFCERIDVALDNIPDEHLFATLDGKPCSSRRRERWNEPARVGANVATGEVWSVTPTQAAGRSILVIAIRSFPPLDDPAWNGFLQTVESHLKEASALILDLRGNTGGDDTFGKRLAARLYGLESPLQPISMIEKWRDPVSLAALANRTHSMIQKFEREKAAVSEGLRRKLREQVSAFESIRERDIAAVEVIEFPKSEPRVDDEKGFKAPIRILIDRNCASSCETTVLSFELHPFAKTVGEATGGAVHFGGAGEFTLPRSGIRVQIPTQVRRFHDGRFIERKGIAPQIRVEPGTDAFDVAKREIADALGAGSGPGQGVRSSSSHR